MSVHTYELVSKIKADLLQQSVTHTVEHGNTGECPTCGHHGIYDLNGSGLTASSIFFSTTEDKWRCMLCDIHLTGY